MKTINYTLIFNLTLYFMINFFKKEKNNANTVSVEKLVELGADNYLIGYFARNFNGKVDVSNLVDCLSNEIEVDDLFFKKSFFERIEWLCEHFKLTRAISTHYKNGNVYKIGNYINGVKTGMFVAKYKTGEVRSLCEYKNGLLQGQFLELYKSGEVMSVCEYRDGKKEGWDMIYYPAGTLLYKNFYDNGTRMHK